MQRHAAGVFVHDAVADYAVRLVVATRDPARAGVDDLAALLRCGASPRATLGLVAGARALALLRGREYVLPSDVRDLAVDVIAHRLVLTLDALADGVEPARRGRRDRRPHPGAPGRTGAGRGRRSRGEARVTPVNVPTVPLSRLSPEAALARLELSVGRRVDGLMHGDHPGFDTGPGSEIAERPALPAGQDDVRHIDWNVSARTDEVHVRDLVADRDLSMWALVDATASMDFGTATMEKRDLAAAVTVALAYVEHRRRPVRRAEVLTADGILRWPHQSGRVHRLKVLRALAESPRQRPSTAARP